MKPQRARGLVIAALAALLAAPLAALGVGGASERPPTLESLVDAFVAHRLARAPYAGRRSGSHAETPLAPAVTAGTLDAQRAWLRDFRARLESLPADPSGSGRALLAAAVEHDSLELEVLRPFERDPGAYVEVIAGSVEAALDRTTLSPCAAVRLAILRLHEVPEVLRAARVNLRNPPRVLTERAIGRYQAVLRFYRRDLPRMAEGCHAPRMQADLAEADTLAIRTVEAFLAYLEQDLLPASRGEIVIGPLACRRLLATSLMAEVAPVESLLAESTRRLDACRTELDSLAPGVSGAGTTTAALESLAVTGPDDRDPVAAGEQALERVRNFLRTSDLVAVPAGVALRVRRARALDVLDGVRLAAGDAGEPRVSPAWLAIAPADSADSAAEGDRSGHWERELAVAAEGIPGRLLRELGGRGPSLLLGRAMADAWNGADWGGYCERTMVDLGYGARDPRYRFAHAARALREAGRSLASLALHAGAMSPPEVIRMLEERCLLTPAEAERQMQWAASDEGLMGYTIGAQRLLELQEEVSRRLGPRFRIRSFNDAVLRCGVAPYGEVRTRVWHELTGAAGNDPVGAKP